jgi:hypothetical protein
MSTIADELFQFASDAEVKAQLQADLVELHVCMESKQWKASIIIIGSLIEAVLYYYIERTPAIRESIPGYDKRPIGLNDLLQWSRQYGVIDNNLFRLAEPIREYRNLIHPRVQDRLKIEVSENLVQIGYNVFHEIVRRTNAHHRTLSDASAETIVTEIVQSICNRAPTRADLQVYVPLLEK